MITKEVKAAIITGVATVLAALVGAWAVKADHYSLLALLVTLLLIAGLLALLLGFLVATRGVRMHTCREIPSSQPLRRMLNRGLRLPALTGSVLVFSGAVCVAVALVILASSGSSGSERSLSVTLNCPPPTEVVRILRENLRVRIETTSYVVEPAPVRDLIANKPGHYYTVDLLSADHEKAWRFKLGEYTLDSFDRDFSRSISTFVRDIIRPIEGKADYSLFVRGSADRDLSGSFRGKFVPGYFYENVSFFPRISRDRYHSDSSSRSIPQRFTNDDLPYVRAAFMQEKLSVEVYDIKKPLILEGEVVRGVASEEFRNATVFLFINWRPDSNDA